MKLDQVRFILVEPQHGGNVGAAARALKNLGFRRMVLVAPRCDPRGEDALRMAVDAADLVLGAEVHTELDEALSGAHTVIGTSGRTGRHRRPHFRLDELAPELPAMVETGGLAFVFGREAHGLRDDELDRCTHLVHFPAAEAYPSFNLAQSVLLAAYEVRRTTLRGPAGTAVAGPPADHDSREAMYEHLARALLSIGFLEAQTSEVMMRRLRRMLGRASLRRDEVRIVRGIARQVLWAAGRAGLVEDHEGGDGC